MIEERLVSFETAVLAKKKGFNEMSTNLWKNPTGLATLCKGVMWYNNRKGEDGRELPAYSAPTQSLLQRWLREIHNIHVIVTHFTNQPIDNELWENCFQVYVQGDGLHPYHRTYEESLEFGLQEGLKRIE
jgi:hypothetical protein